MITRLAIVLSLGLLMVHLGWLWDTLEFWAATLLFFAQDRLSYMDGQRQGTMQGIADYISMTEDQQTHIRQLVNKWKRIP